MPAAKKRDGPASKDATKSKSDDQIMEERSRIDSFANADVFTKFLGWGLWVGAGVWFLVFSTAPSVSSFHDGVGSATMMLCICGHLAGGLSGCSPRGLWSNWRCAWQLSWVGALLCIAGGFSGFVLAAGAKPVESKSLASYALYVAVACAVFAGFAIFTYPKGQPLPTRATGSLAGRLLLLIDGLFGAALCVSIWSSNYEHLGDQLGRSAVAAVLAPLAMWSMAMMCSRTDAEVLVSVPSAILFHAVAACLAVIKYMEVPAEDGTAVVAYSSVMQSCTVSGSLLVIHLSLYLPFPLSDPATNPFYASICRSWRKFYRLLSSPVAGGYTDEAGDG